MFRLIKEIIHPQKGQVLIISVVVLPILLAIAALTLELGNLYVHHSKLQSAADAAALAGAIGDKQKALKLVEINLNDKFKPNVTMYVASSDSDNDKFYVKLEEKVKPIFVKMFNGSDVTIEAYAAASNDKKLIPLPPTEPNWSFKASGSNSWSFQEL